VAATALVLVASSGLWFWFRNTAAADKRIGTIAVLPLRPLSGDEGDKTLALGLTDALITKLGSLKHLVIRPLGAVRGFADGTDDPLETGRRLKVDAVLEGSIQHSDGRLRVNARLLNTATGQQIWGDRFDDDLTNMFEVQDRISETAARALTATLSGAATERLTKRYTESPAAFDAFIKGRYYWNKRTETDFRRAVEYFDQAVAIDPKYALAYAGLADTYILLAVWGTEPPNISFPKAKEAVLKALDADPDLAEAHTSRAFIEWVYDWDFAAADREFDVALQLNPNYATAQHWRSYYLVSMGRNDQAIEAIERARELEGPLSLGIMTDVGEIYCWAGRYDEAVEHLSDIIQREPQYAIAHYVLGITYLKNNMPINAIDELERARQLEDSPRITSALAYAYGAANEIGRARQLLAELKNISAYRYVSPFSIAIAEAGSGDDQAAIDRLEDAYAERSDAMAILMTHPLLARLHSDPRFIDLAKRVGLPA
jgi:TolB-like protein/Tfp pilus assembly protein PilF